MRPPDVLDIKRSAVSEAEGHFRTAISAPVLRALAVAVAFFGLDRYSKIVIVRGLHLDALNDIPVWPPYLRFVMAWNQGINFGWLSDFDARWLLVSLSVVVSVGLIWWVRRALGWRLPMVTGMIVGGALGNAYDRLSFGAVADFINMSCCGFRNPYSFNLADVWIFGGVLLFSFAVHPTGKKKD